MHPSYSGIFACRATEAAGHVAVAVGWTHFAPYVAPCLSLASAGYSLDHLELKENTFAFFGCLARVLASSSEPAARSRLDELVPQVAPVALEVARSNAGLDFIADDGSDAGGERLAERLRELREQSQENIDGASLSEVVSGHASFSFVFHASVDESCTASIRVVRGRTR
jgi:hypothetical protein